MMGSNREGYVLLAVLAAGLLERLVRHHVDLAAIVLCMATGFVLGGLYFARDPR